MDQKNKTTIVRTQQIKKNSDGLAIVDDEGRAIEQSKVKGLDLNKSLADVGEKPKVENLKRATSETILKRKHMGNRTFQNDLFEGAPEVGTKRDNVSKTFYGVEHKHFYRTTRPNGTPEKTSTTTAGHFHYCETHDEAGNQYVTEDNQPAAVCGPPMRLVEFKDRDGRMRERIERVTFQGEDAQGNVRQVFDNHTHKLVYLSTEQLSLSKVSQMRTDAKNEFMGEFGANPGVIANKMPTLSADDPVGMVDSDSPQNSTY